MTDPLKWPILDAAGNPIYESADVQMCGMQDEAMEPLGGTTDFCPVARPLMNMPEPPKPRVLQTASSSTGRQSESESVCSSMAESLNPDVPEFVPVNCVLRTRDETNHVVPSESVDVVMREVDAKNDGAAPKTEGGMPDKSGKKKDADNSATDEDVWKEV